MKDHDTATAGAFLCVHIPESLIGGDDGASSTSSSSSSQQQSPLWRLPQQQQWWRQQHQQHPQQQPAAGFQLSFALSTTYSRRASIAAAPFARLASHQQPPAPPKELFELSRLSGGSSDLSSTVSSGSDSGNESDSDTLDTEAGFSSDLHLEMINCQICRRPLNQRPGKKRLLSWPWGRSSKASSSSGSKGPSTDFLVCDCCQRCYHKHCCKQKGISTRESKGVWYHDASCKDCLQQLKDKVASGAAAVSGGRSWQLVDCAPVDPSAPGGAAALKALKQHLSDVLEVMLPAFGPGAAQQLVDTSKGYAVLLKKGSEPLTAGLMDVYGKEVAVLDLVATAVDRRGEGHCRAMLQALEGWLGPELHVAQLVAVCPADEPGNLAVWRKKFGFQKLDARALKSLQSSVPALNYYEDATLLAKPLKKGRAAKAASGGGGGKLDEAASLPVQPLEA